MMLFKVVSVAVLATIASMISASAQTAGDFGGPAETPPSSFVGQQYVDSQGCVFLRAGYGGRVTWVPQVTAERKPFCGQTPSLAGAVPAVTPAVKAPAKPATKMAAAPKTPKVAAKPAQKARPVVKATPVNAAAGVRIVPSRPGGGKIGCYRSAPVPVMVRQHDGSLVVMCTRGDGTLNGARKPVHVVASTTAATTAKAAPAPVAQPVGDYWLYDPPMFGATGYAVGRRQSGSF